MEAGTESGTGGGRGRGRGNGNKSSSGNGNGDGSGNGNREMNGHGSGHRNGHGDGDENGEGGREGTELGYPPYHDISIEDVDEGVTLTCYQQPQPRHMTPDRSRRAIKEIRPKG